MADLESKKQGVKFEPVARHKTLLPSALLVFFGVICPAATVAIELATRMCATDLFDPMPTLWHTLAVSFVPASNLMLWLHLREGTITSTKWLAFANGAAMAVAGFYALLFLPLAPIAFVAIVVFGIGLLPLGPLFSFVAAVKLRSAFRAKHKDRPFNGPLLGGLAAGLALLLVLDIPQAATRLGIQWASSDVPAQRERGLTLLRMLGDDDLLLRLCYDAVGRPTGLVSTLFMFGGQLLGSPHRQSAPSPADVRELYYRVHGVPFNARPAPYEKGKWSRFADIQSDDDHGGTQVGGRIAGLAIVSSRIDGSISGDDAVAYLEWMVEFRNSGSIDREARMQVALPPGGVVSRATLWINGEEREAAYGGRAEVRAAYQKVAVQQRRDPLLVTSKGADRVLAQAFPVPRGGGTIKFKIGITAPLDIPEPSKARLTLPALVDRNFSFAADMSHSVWIDSKQVLTTSAQGLTASRISDRLFRVSGSVGDRGLSRTRPTITADRNPGAGSLAARIGDGELIVQEIAPSRPPAANTIMIVIDGSARLKDAAASLIKALDAIPPATKVGAMIASEPLQRLSLAPWSELHKQSLTKLIGAASFAGGQDNAPAIAEALQALESESDAKLLWIHGPQPVSFRAGAARLEQAAARLSRLPDVTLYSVEPGPNEALPDSPWAWNARSLPQTAGPETDLAAFFGQAQRLAIRRAQQDNAEGVSKGSDHIARLWANGRVLELMRVKPSGDRAAAVALATQYQLVTPVSGAVVLETQQQYDESRLTPVSQATVPAVPEPHEWALLVVIACAGLMWLVRLRRRHAVDCCA